MCPSAQPPHPCHLLLCPQVQERAAVVLWPLPLEPELRRLHLCGGALRVRADGRHRAVQQGRFPALAPAGGWVPAVSHVLAMCWPAGVSCTRALLSAGWPEQTALQGGARAMCSLEQLLPVHHGYMHRQLTHHHVAPARTALVTPVLPLTRHTHSSTSSSHMPHALTTYPATHTTLLPLRPHRRRRRLLSVHSGPRHRQQTPGPAPGLGGHSPACARHARRRPGVRP
jgi:hypothetical protein